MGDRNPTDLPQASGNNANLAVLPGDHTQLTAAAVTLSCSAWFSIKQSDAGVHYTFRTHQRVATALQIYASVVLSSVNCFVYQSRVYPPTDKGTTVGHYRFGLAPRDLATSGSEGSLAGFVPHLQSYVQGVTIGTSATYSYNTANMPPGLQTDFRATETRFSYAEFFLLCTNPLTTGTANAVCVQLNFTVTCSGLGFGMVQ